MIEGIPQVQMLDVFSLTAVSFHGRKLHGISTCRKRIQRYARRHTGVVEPETAGLGILVRGRVRWPSRSNLVRAYM